MHFCADGEDESRSDQSQGELSDLVTITRKGPAENVIIANSHNSEQVEVDIDFLVTLPLDQTASRQIMTAFRSRGKSKWLTQPDVEFIASLTVTVAPFKKVNDKCFFWQKALLHSKIRDKRPHLKSNFTTRTTSTNPLRPFLKLGSMKINTYRVPQNDRVKVYGSEGH